jgi:2-methylcitrate dehydratase PrpD
MADLMKELVDFVCRTTYADLDTVVIEYAKKHILDTLGSIVAGSSAEGIPEVVSVAQELGGAPQSTVLIYGNRLPVPSAAFATGPMARALDFGAVHSEANEHPNEYTFATALPMAEHLNLSGKDLILSFVLGNELIVRLGASIHTITPVSMTKTHAAFRVWGPTAAAGKLMGLDEERMMEAMGLAFTQGGCDNQMYVDCVLKIRVQHGLLGDAAVKCALLAAKGITGTRNILLGDRGFYAAFAPEHDLSWITDGLREGEFKAVTTRIKGYPTCTYTHSAIEAAMLCMRDNGLAPTEVEKVSVGVNTPTYRQVCEPVEFRYAPRTPIDCQFSIPYTVACAIVKGAVSIGDFSDSAILNSDVRNMMSVIHCNIDPEIDAFCPAGFDGARIVVSTRDGRQLETRLDYARGTPQNPMTMDEIVTKFRSCVPFSAKRMDDRKVDRLIDMVASLEHLESVRDLVSLLTPTV